MQIDSSDIESGISYIEIESIIIECDSYDIRTILRNIH